MPFRVPAPEQAPKVSQDAVALTGLVTCPLGDLPFDPVAVIAAHERARASRATGA